MQPLASLGRVAVRVGTACLQPAFVAVVALIAGAVCAVSGVYLLAGTGWALITAAALLLALSAILMRGLAGGG